MSPTNPPSSAVRPSPGRFSVFVDRRFNFMDESQRYLLGEFASYDAAAEACRKIIDDFLLAIVKPEMSAAELYAAYMAFGEDPIVSPEEGVEPFSASTYARFRCVEIHSKRGFTMVEVPAVIGVLTVLAALLLPAINCVNYPIAHSGLLLAIAGTGGVR